MMEETRQSEAAGDSSRTVRNLRSASLAAALGLVGMGFGVSLRFSAPAPLVDLTRPLPPHDAPKGVNSNLTDLAKFGWQEFVALSWPSVDPQATGHRGTPDTNKSFLDVTAANPLLTVWQTYRHKNEQFPGDKKATDPSFDSKAPRYGYLNKITVPPGTRFDLWNNLDESSQIGLCKMYANVKSGAPDDAYRVLYEAKMNRAAYDYGNRKTSVGALTDPTNGFAALATRTGNTSANLPQYGSICKSADGDKIVMLPCGSTIPGGGEGAIETKAAWRRLTSAEAASGRYYTANVLYYASPRPGTYVAQNATYGLVSLHIIHKTLSFPAFVFTSFEQVDQYPGPRNTLAFVNTKTPISPGTPTQVARDYAIPREIEAVNADVLAQLKTTGSVWKYYKMVGVQAVPFTPTITPSPNPPANPTFAPPANLPPSVPRDEAENVFFLSNIMVETNQTLQNFYGGAPGGLPVPGTNVYAGGKPNQMGGCQGCHGFQGQQQGGDMSILIAKAPYNTLTPEAYNNSHAQAVESALRRRVLPH